jgi:hypothetical protein
MRPLVVAPLLFILALVGCSYHYDLKAIELGGKIAFMPEKEKGTGCFSYFYVTNEAGELVWKLDAGRYLPPPCEDMFPIVYGSVPNGMTDTVPAQPLRAGVLYKVDGWDGDAYSGAFRFRQGIIIVNVDE